MSHHLFLSYSSLDSAAANLIYDKATALGLKVFLAQKSLRGGDDFADEIRSALNGSDEFCLLVTPNSKASAWVVQEWGAAWALGKRVSPILFGCDVTNLPDQLRHLHARDFSEIDLYLAEVVDRVGNRSVAETPTTNLAAYERALLLIALIKGGEIVHMPGDQGDEISIGHPPNRVGFDANEDVRVSGLDAFDRLLADDYLRPLTDGNIHFFVLASRGRNVAKEIQRLVVGLSLEAKELLVAGIKAARSGDDPHFRVGPPGVRGVSVGDMRLGHAAPLEGQRYEDALRIICSDGLASARSNSAYVLTTAGIDLATLLEIVAETNGNLNL